ncbi:hypothetical protein [Vitiosangium sp. GDMCC 1.1324]|uniref:hypothetical protein n=1 Tax=Vitiosangium sp. (strain GDMCC 1.1324) TaxID=2138576 RepID=UPI000D3BADEA|nr:hypothetical protein [Vitiosangium sp. GDMCC 1.1324]PTL78465.1 hypothetical protein DAT35_38700 [Vitiosangium sp. GDMCC 1.1324]
MKLPTYKTLLANAACLLTLGWLYGGDLRDALRARSAEVSAFLAPPPVVWPSLVLAATAVALGTVLWGVSRDRAEGFKGYRLLPILLVSALFFDLVLAESQMPLRSEDLAALALSQFQEKASALARGQTVPSDPAVLEPLLKELGAPPYLVRGVPARAWSLQVRQECQGPVQEAPGLAVGTLIYCVAPGRGSAWVSLVGLPAGERFGLPSVLSVEGQPHVAIVRPALPEEREAPEAGEEEESIEVPFQVAPGAPTPDVALEATDAGAVAPAPTP